MRITLLAIMATLTLGFGYGPALAQTSGGPAFESIHMVDALTGWAVTDRQDANALLHTTDGGAHWRVVTPPGSAGPQITIYRAAVLTSLTAWVLSSGKHAGTSEYTTKIFHTVDGGRNWKNVTVQASHGVSVSFISARDGWLLNTEAAAGSEEVDIYRSTDSGENWGKVGSTRADDESSGLPFAGNKLDIAFLNATTGWITGTILTPNSLYFYVTHDGGRTWRQQQLPRPPQVISPWTNVTKQPKFFTTRDGILPVYYAYNRSAAVVVFYATHDGGTTWTSITPVSVTTYWGPSSFADVSHGWVAEGDALYLTKDSGRQWTKIEPGPPFTDVNQLDFVSPYVGWAVTEVPPFLLKTVDGGHTWAPVMYAISWQ